MTAAERGQPNWLTSARHMRRDAYCSNARPTAPLAASFALSCQQAAARNDKSYFSQVKSVGYLVHIESIADDTRGGWSMLQDVSAAAAIMMGRVQMTVAAEGGASEQKGDTTPIAVHGVSEVPGAHLLLAGARLS